MWKRACAFTKWVPSNQFMYANLDYNPATMTLERFGFIGMDKKCFWGAIGVLWKRPLAVDQILPNATNPITNQTVPQQPANNNEEEENNNTGGTTTNTEEAKLQTKASVHAKSHHHKEHKLLEMGEEIYSPQSHMNLGLRAHHHMHGSNW